MSFRVVNGKPYAVGYFGDNQGIKNNAERSKIEQTLSFKEILESKVNKEDTFKISNHAAERIKTMNLTEEDMKKIGEGINTAKEKGCRNSLILYKDIAFVTSIENRTLITAVEKERAKENLYTNIDSVLFL